jgi:predicted transcriptional regulator
MKNKKILISIKPKFVEKILSGDKKYEYRTKRPKTNINTMLIYCTSPTMKIVAEASIEHIICGTPNKI